MTQERILAELDGIGKSRVTYNLFDDAPVEVDGSTIFRALRGRSLRSVSFESSNVLFMVYNLVL